MAQERQRNATNKNRLPIKQTTLYFIEIEIIISFQNMFFIENKIVLTAFLTIYVYEKCHTHCPRYGQQTFGRLHALNTKTNLKILFILFEMQVDNRSIVVYTVGL